MFIMSNFGIWGSGYYPNCYLEVTNKFYYFLYHEVDVLGPLLERDSCCLILVSITTSQIWPLNYTGKNNRFPFLDILGYLKKTHKNPKFGRVRQVPIWELGWEFPGWDLSHLAKFGIFMGYFKYPKISKNGNPLVFPVLNHLIWVADYRRFNCS